MLALITATRNSISTIVECLDSTRQIRDRIKHIFVDGRSVDGTAEHLTQYALDVPNVIVKSQEDEGIYEALNQGIEEAMCDPNVSHIGLLHSDDRLDSENYEKYIAEIGRNHGDVYYSDIQFHGLDDRVVRSWKAGRFSPLKFQTGWMPPHTSMIVTKKVYEEVGLYDPTFGTAADYEWIVRVLTDRKREICYFPKRTVSMLTGGASNFSLKARLRANAMDGAVWAGRSRLQSAVIRVCKPMRKIGQFLVLKDPK